MSKKNWKNYDLTNPKATCGMSINEVELYEKIDSLFEQAVNRKGKNPNNNMTTLIGVVYMEASAQFTEDEKIYLSVVGIDKMIAKVVAYSQFNKLVNDFYVRYSILDKFTLGEDDDKLTAHMKKRGIHEEYLSLSDTFPESLRPEGMVCP